MTHFLMDMKPDSNKMQTCGHPLYLISVVSANFCVARATCFKYLRIFFMALSNTRKREFERTFGLPIMFPIIYDV